MQLARDPATSHLIIGAAKSGKSTYAEELVSALDPPYIYIATARALDSEMEQRIKAHKARRNASWQTIEAPLALAETLQGLIGSKKPVLVDCLTLWLTNLLLDPSAPDPIQAVSSLCGLIKTLDYPLFIVSNEVGGGIVPEAALARRFRDLAGLANQEIAKASSAVTLVVAGLPLKLK